MSWRGVGVGLLMMLCVIAQQNRPRITSPEVQSDRRVTFRLWAPDATTVRLSGDWMGREPPADFKKGDDGVWTSTVGPLDPDLYTYSFLVNGVRTNDPACVRCSFTSARRSPSSYFVIPGESSAPNAWDPRATPVPAGTLHLETYWSKRQDRQRRFRVYTPAGYGKTRAKYPVLLLMPGTPGEEDDWTDGGGFAERIIDNLIADGKVRPMIVVMHASDVLVKGGTRADNLKDLEPVLVNELVPEVRARYGVEADPQFWAIAGYSLGGEAALVVGLRHPEVFRWVASMGGSIFEREFDERFAGVWAAPGETAKKYQLIWLRCGSKDLFLPGSQALAVKLKGVGVPVDFEERPGFHALQVFRRQLVELLPRLFRD